MKQILLVVGLLISVAASSQDSLLTRKIDALIAKLPAGSEAGICVYDLTAGRLLADYRADKLSRPASTMKLLTAVTALDRDDTDRPFTTSVYYTGTIDGDTLRGDVYVVGGFDPEFGDAAMDSLVAAASSQPFKAISGHIYGDVSLKDSLYWGRGWAWDDTPDYYQPYMSTLMFARGTVKIAAAPSAIRGEEARLTCLPRSTFYTVSNRTKSNTPSAGEFSVTRDWLSNSNRITATGNVNGSAGATINVFSTGDYFMHTFTERLAERGLTATGGYSFATLPDDSTCVLMAERRTPLQDVVNRTMKKSDNLNAEALLWRIGLLSNPGKRYISATDGLKEVNMMIRRAGMNPSNYKIVDGCGLSNYDYLSPELLVAVLRYAYSKTTLFRMLYRSLPVAGVDGTLRSRMKQGKAYSNVHAKTGSYTAINALAGYLKRSDGHDVAFAIMNQNILSAAAARSFQDAVCQLLCE